MTQKKVFEKGHLSVSNLGRLMASPLNLHLTAHYVCLKYNYLSLCHLQRLLGYSKNMYDDPFFVSVLV
jgi:hypothetical protein